MLAGTLPYGLSSRQVESAFALPMAPLLVYHDQQQALTPQTPTAWNSWTGSWDQQSLANSFNTMTLTPRAITTWDVDSGASNHMTLDSGNISMFRPPTSAIPSSIIVGNGSILPVTSVGD
ncbi:hypothetical protein GUJ93_ZPchr0008g12771 [Zizania palustris]|uniref:Uncharacterized protein n=1 Tax=Zizania palustris TaxID=103762 RepID=A0A8J5RDS4_ZIZPA|nr:hypothetical protein GUJ93_ZPchr0008g12771 [Zizania palustris]